jgi:hypothetical protein
MVMSIKYLSLGAVSRTEPYHYSDTSISARQADIGCISRGGFPMRLISDLPSPAVDSDFFHDTKFSFVNKAKKISAAFQR